MSWAYICSQRIKVKNYDNYRKNTIEDSEYNDYINSQLIIYETQLKKLRNLLQENDLLALEKKDDPSLLKEIKMDQKDIYAEIRKIEKELNKIQKLNTDVTGSIVGYI